MGARGIKGHEAIQVCQDERLVQLHRQRAEPQGLLELLQRMLPTAYRRVWPDMRDTLNVLVTKDQHSRVLKGGPRDQVLLIAVQVQRNRAEQHMAPLPLPLRAAAAARARRRSRWVYPPLSLRE